ncbi:MAG: hypothetical protein O9972_48005 [Burkholderiales bacterium]|nr:hypothetical protein [Burkholderiales bacterium]
MTLLPETPMEKLARQAREWKDAYSELSPEMELLQAMSALALATPWGPDSRLEILAPFDGDLERVPRALIPELLAKIYDAMIGNAMLALQIGWDRRH